MIGEKQHAVLSPSGASRWLTCTPSARLEEQFPDTTSEAAKEGTVAHALGELMLREYKKQIRGVKAKRELAEIQKSEFYNKAMQEYIDSYYTFVLERFADAKAKTSDALLEIEARLDLREYIPEGFGTGDAIIVADGTLDLIDLKYGKGVEVSAVENKQMMIYALGALSKYDLIYDIRNVRMTIYQPRLDNFSTWELPAADLKAWAQDELIPKARMAYAGEGEYMTGPHCQFCRAKAVCKAHAAYQLQIARYEFREADLLSDQAVADVLDRVKDFKSWLKSVEEYALNAATKDGKKWPGYKLVAGRSNRIITDEARAAEKLKALGYPETDIYNTKLQGITRLEELLGKETFATELGDLVDKPDGKPTLVPDFDKRPELNSTESAIKDFNNVTI